MGYTLDFSVVWHAMPALLWGCVGTLGLALAGMTLAMVIGVAGVAARDASAAWLRAIVIGFVEIVRNTAFPGADFLSVLRPAAHRVEAQSNRDRRYRPRCQWGRLCHRDHPRRRPVYTQGTNRGGLRARTAQRAGVPVPLCSSPRFARFTPSLTGQFIMLTLTSFDLFRRYRLTN